MPSERRGAPGFLLKAGGRAVAIDMGSGCLQKMLRTGVDYLNLDAIVLTHLHPDHVSDLLPFLFACKYSLAPRTKDLYLLGGKGLREYYDGLRSLYGHWVKADTYRLHIQEAPGGKRSLFDLSLFTLPLPHTRSSIGLRFEGEGKVLCVSGDTDYCEELVELARGADLLVLECSFPDERKVQGHLTPSLCGRVAREAGAKRLVLTHLYPPCDEGDILSPCRREFGGEVLVAEDMMSLALD